jgi:hypothetical protein
MGHGEYRCKGWPGEVSLFRLESKNAGAMQRVVAPGSLTDLGSLIGQVHEGKPLLSENLATIFWGAVNQYLINDILTPVRKHFLLADVVADQPRHFWLGFSGRANTKIALRL